MLENKKMREIYFYKRIIYEISHPIQRILIAEKTDY